MDDDFWGLGWRDILLALVSGECQSREKTKRYQIIQYYMLIEFYGEECPHCENMAPLVERLEKEEGGHVEKLEIWHDEGNARKMEAYDQGSCGGVPFFYNTETKECICGEDAYDTLKKWAGK